MSRSYRPNQEDELIIDAVTVTVASLLNEWYGPQAALRAKEPTIRLHPSSIFLRYSIITPLQPGKFILVKIRRRPQTRSLAETTAKQDIHNNIQAEYLALQSVYEFLENTSSNLRAIRPLAYLDEWSALVMEEQPAVTLRHLLMRWQLQLGQKEMLNALTDAARKAGQWLYLFHHKIHACSDIEPVEKLTGTVHFYAQQLENASHGRVEAQFVQSLFDEKISRLAHAPLPVSISHGDMTCDNMLYSTDGKIYSIDIKNKPAPNYSDLGLILVHPETFKIQFLSLGMFFRETTLKAYRKAILEGYFNREPGNDGLVNLYCAIMLLDKWAMHEKVMSRYRGPKRLISFFARVLLRAYFPNRIKKYTNSTSLGCC